ncbi:MAG: hypothetical protein Q8P67_08255 [archaeon]|nr:hypothetical protein [archaeon]
MAAFSPPPPPFPPPLPGRIGRIEIAEIAGGGGGGGVMGVCSTEPFHGHSVAYSPYSYTGVRRLAVATSQYYGLVGNGRLYVVDHVEATGTCEVVRVFRTLDVLFDCAWSERNENHLLTACSDGAARLWDLSPGGEARPLASYRMPELGRGGASLMMMSSSSSTSGPSNPCAPNGAYGLQSAEWNGMDRELFACAGGGGVAVWTVEQERPLALMTEHRDLVYAAQWSPHKPTLLLSASADSTVKLWDLHSPRSALTLAAHQHHAMSCDWNKYSPNVVASASADKTVKIWDLRAPFSPLARLSGHTLPVRRVAWSPHRESLLASVSYDRTLKMWDVAPGREDALVYDQQLHGEFATGLAFSLHVPGEVATCGWDARLVISRSSFF